jgi:hypothetical protein
VIYWVILLVMYNQKTDCIPSTSPEQGSHVITPIFLVSYSDDSESGVDYAVDEKDSCSDLDLGYNNDDQIQENFQYQKYQGLIHTLLANSTPLTYFCLFFVTFLNLIHSKWNRCEQQFPWYTAVSLCAIASGKLFHWVEYKVSLHTC